MKNPVKATISSIVAASLCASLSICPAYATSTTQLFSDVSAGAWYESDVQWAYDNNVMKGYADKTFGVGKYITRAEFAQVLANQSGDTLVTTYDVTGKLDLKSNAWFTGACNWAYSNGLMLGYGESDYFGVNDSLTRAQVVVVLWRQAGSPNSSYSLSKFTDAASVPSYSKTAFAWAVENKIITGVDKGSSFELQPDRAILREEVSKIVHVVSELDNSGTVDIDTPASSGSNNGGSSSSSSNGGSSSNNTSSTGTTNTDSFSTAGSNGNNNSNSDTGNTGSNDSTNNSSQTSASIAQKATTISANPDISIPVDTKQEAIITPTPENTDCDLSNGRWKLSAGVFGTSSYLNKIGDKIYNFQGDESYNTLDSLERQMRVYWVADDGTEALLGSLRSTQANVDLSYDSTTHQIHFVITPKEGSNLTGKLEGYAEVPYVSETYFEPINCYYCKGTIQDADGYYPVTYLTNTENSSLKNKLYLYGKGVVPISLTTKQWTVSAPSYLGEYDEFLEGKTVYGLFSEASSKYTQAYDKENGLFLNSRSIGDESDASVIEFIKKQKLTSPQTAKNTTYFCTNQKCTHYQKETIGYFQYISWSSANMNVLGH
jgi:hypothetical protein